MADWPLWVWILIAVVAVLIIAAIIFGTRRKDEIDEGGPFAQEHHPGDDSLTPRRGTTEPVADVAPQASGPVTPSRSADVDEDEETLTGPLTVPAESAATTAGPAPEEVRMASEPVEDFAADAPAAATDPVGPVMNPAREHPHQTAGDPPPQRPEDDFAPDEPVVAEPNGMASRDPQSHFEAPVDEDRGGVAPESVADEGRAVEAVPETAPAPATEEPVPPRADTDSPDDADPPEQDFAPPRHAESADHGDPVSDVDVDDDVPRDDLGRRLDPYGNPVD